MEEKQELTLTKPQFDGEIKAKIKSLGEIESNIKEVQNYALALNDYYKKVIFTDETMKIAKDEKSKVIKFKQAVSDYRKKTIEEYKKPILQFESLSKDTEKILADTYTTINLQVEKYENKQKQEKENEVKEYFEEYKQSLNIDFITFEDTKIRVGLSDTKTSLKKQAKDFVDRVNTDLATIMLQENKEEILVEYKQNGYVLNTAISTVLNRIKAVEETRRKQEELVNKRLEEETKATEEALNNFKVNVTATTENHAIVDNALKAPIAEEKEEILKLKFVVKGTRTQLKALKEFLINGGYEYE